MSCAKSIRELCPMSWNFPKKKLVCHPKDIVKSLEDSTFLPSAIPLHQPRNPTKLISAKEIVYNDSISFSARLSVFTVVDGTNVNTVRLHPKSSCSCAVKSNCVHIMAVKMALRLDIDETSIDYQQNVGMMRKNARVTKNKSQDENEQGQETKTRRNTRNNRRNIRNSRRNTRNSHRNTRNSHRNTRNTCKNTRNSHRNIRNSRRNTRNSHMNTRNSHRNTRNSRKNTRNTWKSVRKF